MYKENYHVWKTSWPTNCQKVFVIFTDVKAQEFLSLFSHPFFLPTFNDGKFFQRAWREVY